MVAFIYISLLTWKNGLLALDVKTAKKLYQDMFYFVAKSNTLVCKYRLNHEQPLRNNSSFFDTNMSNDTARSDQLSFFDVCTCIRNIMHEWLQFRKWITILTFDGNNALLIRSNDRISKMTSTRAYNHINTNKMENNIHPLRY